MSAIDKIVPHKHMDISKIPDLEVLASHRPQGRDDVGVGREPVHGLAPALEVLDHGVETLGGGEVSVGHVHAVNHHGHRAAALLDRRLADQVPHVGHRGEHDALVRGHTDVVLVNPGHLKHYWSI